MVMPSQQLQDRLKNLCSRVSEDGIQSFLARMDSEYFSRFSPEDIAHHIHLADRLDGARPCQVSFSKRPEYVWEVLVVAYDYFSEFSLVCGLLSAYRLDIREGSVYTFRPEPVEGPKSSQPQATGIIIQAGG